MRSARKSDFADLVRYITATQGKAQRVGQVVLTNCKSDNAQDAAIEVRLTQQENTRSGADKTYHLVVSFRTGEQSSAAVLRAIEQRLCEGLGFGEHQRVSASHHDTDNLHVHIAINKVHPTRHTVHAPYYDHMTLGKLCGELETTFGLQADNHATQRRGAQGRAVGMEQHAGVESLVGWVQRECLDRIQDASNWAELHDTLFELGLELSVQANGFLLTDREGHHAKASSVDRSLSRPRLEQRLGPFEPSAHVPANSPTPADPAPSEGAQTISRTRYEKKPFASRVDTTALYARYQKEKELSAQARTAETVVLRQRQSLELERLRRTGGLQPAATKLLGGDRLTRKAFYALAARIRQADLAQLRERHRRERHFLRQQFTRKVWAEWLEAQALGGDPVAMQALQARRAVSTHSVEPTVVLPHRAGLATIRDDGHRLQVAQGASQDAVEAALRLAIERYGARLQVTGSDEFKTRVIAAAAHASLPVTFADDGLDRRRQALFPTASQEPIHDHIEERRHPDAGGAGIARPGAAHGHRAGQPGGSARRGGSGADVRSAREGDPDVAPASSRSDDRPTQRGKPHVGRAGSQPPPAAKNRLRNLSQLGVVQLARGGEVLLPGDVPGRLEQPGPQPDHALRRPASGAGDTVASRDAVEKLLVERNEKRKYINDIPKYGRYTHADEAIVRYVGTRNVDGQFLALLQREDRGTSQGQVDVLPIDAVAAMRLKRFRIGDVITVRARTDAHLPESARAYTFKPSAVRTTTPRKGRSR